MIQESIIWARLNSYSRDLLKETSQLQITQKIRVDLLENREKEIPSSVLQVQGPSQYRHG